MPTTTHDTATQMPMLLLLLPWKCSPRHFWLESKAIMASEMESNPHTIAGKCISGWCCGGLGGGQASKQATSQSVSHESSIGLESNAMGCGAIVPEQLCPFYLKAVIALQCNTLWHGSTFAGPTTLRPVTRFSSKPVAERKWNCIEILLKI